jgi:CcmD family protein
VIAVENLGYLFAAFAVVWAITFGYLLVLLARQRTLRREIDSLKKVLSESPTEGSG